MAEEEVRTEETSELEALQKERDELVDTLQRVQAEFDNYRKRAGGGGGAAAPAGAAPAPRRES
jgi:molecular chaperone GrpE (heat shock protein)